MNRSLAIYAVLFFGFFSSACSSNKLSERDKFLQDQQQGIDVKKGELSSVAGEYVGTLTSSDGSIHNVKLILQVKDVPEAKGDADPVLIPKLLGSLRFIIGNEALGENIDCAIKSSEYVKARNQISLVVFHAQFNELVISATANGSQITGTWNATSVSRNGQIQVSRK